MSGINYLMNILQTYPITDEAKNTQMNTIIHTLHNNEYDQNIIEKLSTQKKIIKKKPYTLICKVKSKMGYIYIYLQKNYGTI
jgi:hypothetical protein